MRLGLLIAFIGSVNSIKMRSPNYSASIGLLLAPCMGPVRDRPRQLRPKRGIQLQKNRIVHFGNSLNRTVSIERNSRGARQIHCDINQISTSEGTLDRIGYMPSSAGTLYGKTEISPRGIFWNFDFARDSMGLELAPRTGFGGEESDPNLR